MTAAWARRGRVGEVERFGVRHAVVGGERLAREGGRPLHRASPGSQPTGSKGGVYYLRWQWLWREEPTTQAAGELLVLFLDSVMPQREAAGIPGCAQRAAP